jgi:hypothetical protein
VAACRPNSSSQAPARNADGWALAADADPPVADPPVGELDEELEGELDGELEAEPDGGLDGEPDAGLDGELDGDPEADADPLGEGEGEVPPAPPDAFASGPLSSGGLPAATDRAASRTAGSTTQVSGAVAFAVRDSSRSRRPSGASRRSQPATPVKRAAPARCAGWRNGTSSAIRVCDRSPAALASGGSSGMKVRARPSATESRPLSCAPSTCTPTQ